MSEYDKNVKIWKKAYTEIKEVCEKYAVEFDNKYGFYDIREELNNAKAQLKRIEYYEKYGIRLEDPVKTSDWHNIDTYRAIGFYDGERRTISWPEGNKQPHDEYLYKIGFSTGAYIFGEDYPKEIFKDFFEELKTYKPDYEDNHNSAIYFTLANAKAIHDDFPKILKKYKDRNHAELKQRQADKLRKQLAEIESEL